MGENIEKSDFERTDFRNFERRLRAETDLLSHWLKDGRFAAEEPVAGCELEAWLVGPDGRPAARNEEFLGAVDDPMVVPELAQFNVEFNAEPRRLTGDVFTRMETDLRTIWNRSREKAQAMDLDLAMIGILPTVREDDLTMDALSHMERYRALNEQIMRLRKGKALRFDIAGREHLEMVQTDIMLEAATTSFQIHLQVRPDEAVRIYNASKIASAPLVAAAANSPFLFGLQLWDETRIPLFEQAVSVGKWDYAERVTFGIRFLEDSIYEYFKSNRQRYPVILPKLYDARPEAMRHLKLHNGTVWRWNRQLVGFDAAGTPHLRLEQRVVPAGPTVLDSIANAAFYYGLVRALADREPELEMEIPFHVARDNFYSAARLGLGARIEWKQEAVGPIRAYIGDYFIPLARDGLDRLGVDKADSERLLGIIAGRIETGQNGAAWQRAYRDKYDCSMSQLLAAYMERSETGRPVHEWPL